MALNTLLDGLNGMQILIHMSMVNVPFPAAVRLFNSDIINIAKFDLIDIQDETTEVFGLPEEEPLSE